MAVGRDSWVSSCLRLMFHLHKIRKVGEVINFQIRSIGILSIKGHLTWKEDQHRKQMKLELLCWRQQWGPGNPAL